MNADELRAPLSQLEVEALVESCAASGVPLRVTDPVPLGRAAALLRDASGTAPVVPDARAAS